MTDAVTPSWRRPETFGALLAIAVLAIAGFVAGHHSGSGAAASAGADRAIPDRGVVAVRVALPPAAALPGLAQPPRRSRAQPPAAAVAPATPVVTPVVTPTPAPAPAPTPVVTPTPAPVATTPAKPAPTNAGKTFDESG